MAMQKQIWSISGLSVELGIDRRTLSKKLERLQPVKVDGKSRLYYMADVIKCLRLFDVPTFRYEDDEKVESRKVAEEISMFFDHCTDALREYLWEKESQSTDQNAEHSLTMLQGIWGLQVEALESWVGLENTYNLQMPEFLKCLQDPDKFKEEAELLVDCDISSRAKKSDVDLSSIEFDLSDI